MEQAILLALAASFCTATSSVCQRLGARDLGGSGFDMAILFRLARRPVWLLGLASMILGFVFQIIALHFGDLALVQPILATELIFVFAYMSIIGTHPVRRRDWLAAATMAAGLGLFLFVGSPSGGHLHAHGFQWWLAGATTLGAVLLLLAIVFGWGRRPGGAPSRRAATLGVATGVSWGFVAGVIKELSSHLDGGVGAIVSNWSLYVLIGAGAMSMLLASHALRAGPMAASQPGFTIVDPLSATLLGLFLFGEHIRVGTLDLAGEAFALAVLVAGVSVLSHSQLVVQEDGPSGAGPASGDEDDPSPPGPTPRDRSDPRRHGETDPVQVGSAPLASGALGVDAGHSRLQVPPPAV